ncbi:DNA/RNA helicase domain-containing protein [Nonomuraea sp. NPDC049129]|uniref:DNA/RNA helicase domain-containing protein n=1 Tax=Nonomuraea sp. NPDC049129 TaxID=3155272 RepID=UPI00340C1FBF
MKPRYLVARSAGDLAAMETDDLVRTLARRAREVYQVAVGDSEKQSWRASIKTVVNVLLQAGLGDVMVLLEMSTLSSNARIDMLLVGSHPNTGELSAVAVENKQWSRLAFNPRTRRITHLGAGHEDSQHPVEQVWDYCWALERQVPMLRGALRGVANMHNASSTDIAKIMPPVSRLRPEIDDKRVRAFSSDADDRREFARFLSTVLSAENARHHVHRINHAHVRPTEEVMHAAYAAVRGRAVFPLLDEQRETVDKVLALVQDGFSANSKQVFIVTGGPGTGKTVLALELLGMLNGISSSAAHASGSAAFSAALRLHVTGRHGNIPDLFTYFNQHRHREPNHLNVLICDEAHRLRKTSNSRFDKPEQRSHIPQIHELIQAARVPVFLLDPNQVVRNDEIGSPEEIRQAALALGIPDEHIHHIPLQRQFRHSHCPEYVDWLEDLLGYGTNPRPWTYQGEFQLLRAETPQQMEDYLRAQIALHHSARITAGYCWDWTQKYLGGRLARDIRIGDWAWPWNAHKANRHRNIPDRTLWATDPNGFEQIGCIYTAQSFDWDYAGVIIGYDYTWSDNEWKSANNKDRATWGDDRHRLVRNIYRVLASRGKHGVVLHSTDPATRDLLLKLKVPPVQAALEALNRKHPGLTRSAPAAPVQEALPWWDING